MMMSIWFVAIGLTFGWCVLLVSIDSVLPRIVRGVIALSLGALAGYLFDFVAFEASHSLIALGGGALGGVLASGVHELFASGLERRAPRKESNSS